VTDLNMNYPSPLIFEAMKIFYRNSAKTVSIIWQRRHRKFTVTHAIIVISILTVNRRTLILAVNAKYVSLGGSVAVAQHLKETETEGQASCAKCT
jgi:Na+/citrate or Na+/malate symporter